MARKNGSIAIPFLFTFLIALLLVGGAGIYIYDYFELDKKEELEEPYTTDYDTVSYEDSHTILFILDVPEQRCSSTFLVMRSVPKEKKILLTGIPTNSIMIYNDKQSSLKEVYENEGAASAEDFIEDILDIEIDRYMKFNSEAFLKLSDIMGGVSYGVTADIVGFQDTDKEQYLNGSQTITLLTYSLFSGGEVERASMAASVISAMINQSDGARLADGFDRNFNTIINMVETNVTAVDYKEKKYAIKFMLNYGSSISHFSMLTGTTTNDYFVVDETYDSTLIDEYFTEHTDDEESSSETSKK